MVVSNIFHFHPYLGKIPILTNIFQMGWFNHQPENTYHLSRMQSFPLQILRAESALKLKMDDEKVRKQQFQREKLGTLGRVHTNIYHLYMNIYALYTGCIGEFFPLTVVLFLRTPNSEIAIGVRKLQV